MPVLWGSKVAGKLASSSRPHKDVSVADGAVKDPRVTSTRSSDKKTLDDIASYHV